MAGYGLTQAAQNFFNTKWGVEDRYRRAQKDEEEKLRRDAEIERQKQIDERNRIDQDQRMNFAAQDQAMQAGLYDNQMQDRARTEKLRKDTEQAALDSRALSTGYDQADFQPENENGVMPRARTGLVHEPTRLMKMQQVDPVNSASYGEKLQKMKSEGVVKAAELVKQGRIKEAEDYYNATGAERVKFVVDPKTKKVMAHEDDGAVSEFNPDVILKKAAEPYTLGKDQIRYDSNNKPIAYGSEADPKAKDSSGDSLISIDGKEMKVSEADTWFRRDNNIPDEFTIQLWQSSQDEGQRKMAADAKAKLAGGALFSNWLKSVGAKFPQGMLNGANAPVGKNRVAGAPYDEGTVLVKDGKKYVVQGGRPVPVEANKKPMPEKSGMVQGHGASGKY